MENNFFSQFERKKLLIDYAVIIGIKKTALYECFFVWLFTYTSKILI
jgi:hypothetical protein